MTAGVAVAAVLQTYCPGSSLAVAAVAVDRHPAAVGAEAVTGDHHRAAAVIGAVSAAVAILAAAEQEAVGRCNISFQHFSTILNRLTDETSSL